MKVQLINNSVFVTYNENMIEKFGVDETIEKQMTFPYRVNAGNSQHVDFTISMECLEDIVAKINEMGNK
jgi:hypothetical protein